MKRQWRRLTGPMATFFEFRSEQSVREGTTKGLFCMNLTAATKPAEYMKVESGGTHKGSPRVRPKEGTTSVDVTHRPEQNCHQGTFRLYGGPDKSVPPNLREILEPKQR